MDRMENKLGVRDSSPVDEDKGGTRKAKVSARSLGAQKRKRTAQEPDPAAEERKKAAKEAREKKLAEKDVKVIVAVDFGTTHTGIAYVSSNKTSHDVDVLLKLLLDGATSKTDFDDELLLRCIGGVLMSLPPDRTPKELAERFLKCVHNHIGDRLCREIGRNAVEQTSFRYVITLPATWSPAAREATRQAARNAGFGSREKDELLLVDEPEAAAVAAIKSVTASFDVHTFQPGTCATIVDIGGGTTDLVTYKIVKTDPLKLGEACVGQGGKCGATAIERALHGLLEHHFGAAFSELAATKIGAGSKFMEAFETVKRGFEGVVNGKVYELPLWMAKVNMESSEMKESEELGVLFEPVLEKAFELVKKQIKRTKKAKMPAVKTMVLCGGLASSTYVCTRFEDFIKTLRGENIELVVPKKSWSAIARGAAICGLENSPVLFRRSRDHIGFCVHVKFDEDKHELEDLFECPVRGPRAMNQMRWDIASGDEISLGMKKRFRAYVVIDKAEARKDEVLIDQTIYRCSKKKAPSRMGPSVVKMGTITMNLTKFVKEERVRIKKQTNKFPEHHSYDIEILVTTSSSKGVLEVTSKIGRRSIGSTTIEYEADPAWKGSLVTGDD
ncbi:hypothetical protein A1O1_05217 [Capronia coronata CBS 617.96]|uniref:Hsp70-like protein n=1 Tax=Capronia coronata CBS 617.96 TaxID=1182541 RepID=W9Y629_9EURO|nr:uncharacterized protein A1O1_05217 [Capronia coronata CBS 617.96]EXJ88287.1 hypothetical protein A1O1_05217 [Capronia coronata CBS 617.96]